MEQVSLLSLRRSRRSVGDLTTHLRKTPNICPDLSTGYLSGGLFGEKTVGGGEMSLMDFELAGVQPHAVDE